MLELKLKQQQVTMSGENDGAGSCSGASGPKNLLEMALEEIGWGEG